METWQNVVIAIIIIAIFYYAVWYLYPKSPSDLLPHLQVPTNAGEAAESAAGGISVVAVTPEPAQQVMPVAQDMVPQVPEQMVVPVSWSKTPAIGTGSGGAFDYKCPEGTFMTMFRYLTGYGLDSFSIECNNTISSQKFGGPGGVSSGSYNFPSGTDSFYLTGNKYIGNITPGNQKSADLRFGGRALGDFSGSTAKVSCPSGSKISGVYGTESNFVNSLGFYCNK